MNNIKIDTKRGVLKAQAYNDGIAQGFNLWLNDTIVAVVEVYDNPQTEDEIMEARVLVYEDPEAEEPTQCFTVND